ncbi:hypothetical protein PPERSA_11643 [Pseudocohnilembus persalinus]|uniref:Uncharacterized protein n=1 Tax=Pseudocohnilembus persalinus TaxID=266149 RepID=A0A0V0QA14_PSEPJ|nr:hypothetical protein PPERSA_11643 [Pseudocohnilembus persalinus]|eukprot:KRW99042.1 hypothetical protein PPERSA_11643 [Pseudocohnilembus persalinus]
MSHKRPQQLIKKLHAIRNMYLEPSKWHPEIFKEDDKYYYYYTQEKTIAKVAKNWEPRKGYIRLEFLERPYRWWRYRTNDGQNSLIAFFISVFLGWAIFESAMYITNTDKRIEEMGRFPEEFNEDDFQKNLELKEKVQEWKKNKELQQQEQKQEQDGQFQSE